MSAAMGEEQKKEGDGMEHMEEDVVPENGQDKDAAGGEDKGGGSGTAALSTFRRPLKFSFFSSFPQTRTL